MTRTVKSETDDPKRALAIVEEQRNKGYNAWIEDQSGKSVDEESLKNNDVKQMRLPLYAALHFPIDAR
jgi:hypothetical protein